MAKPGLCCLIMEAGTSVLRRRSPWMFAVALAFLVAGCDPIVSIQGSFFPSWIVCMSVGGVVTVVFRQLFAGLRLEPHLGPLLIVYPSLWILLTMLLWLSFYRT
jgi:hypothetical protein